MRAMRAAALVLVLGALAGCAKEREAASPSAEPAPGTTEWKVATALGAGPDWLASAASVAEWPVSDTAEIAVLRPSSGGWTCFPDLPATPRTDPVCVDDQFFRWLDAWRAHRQYPQLDGMAVAYALRGLQVASLTEPFRAAPDSGQPWIELAPAVLLAMPTAASYRGLPTARPAAGPWVLWAGTPWALMVVPVGAMVAAPADSAAAPR